MFLVPTPTPELLLQCSSTEFVENFVSTFLKQDMAFTSISADRFSRFQCHFSTQNQKCTFHWGMGRKCFFPCFCVSLCNTFNPFSTGKKLRMRKCCFLLLLTFSNGQTERAIEEEEKRDPKHKLKEKFRIGWLKKRNSDEEMWPALLLKWIPSYKTEIWNFLKFTTQKVV